MWSRLRPVRYPSAKRAASSAGTAQRSVWRKRMSCQYAGSGADQFNADIAFRRRRDIRSARRATLNEGGQITPCRRVARLLIRSGTIVYARPVLQLAVHQDTERAIRVGHGIRRMQVCRRDLRLSRSTSDIVFTVDVTTEVRSSGEVRPCGGVRPADECPHDGNGEDGADAVPGSILDAAASTTVLCG